MNYERQCFVTIQQHASSVGNRCKQPAIAQSAFSAVN